MYLLLKPPCFSPPSSVCLSSKHNEIRSYLNEKWCHLNKTLGKLWHFIVPQLCVSTNQLTYVLDIKAFRWLQGPPGPAVPEDLQVDFFALDEQHALIYPAQEEDVAQGLSQRLVPEVLHVDGFKVGEHLVAAVMLEVVRCWRWRWRCRRCWSCRIFSISRAVLGQHQSQWVRRNRDGLLHVCVDHPLNMFRTHFDLLHCFHRTHSPPLFFRSLREWSARCARVREALRWPGGCTCSRCSAGAPCKSRRQRAGWRCERLFQLANCQGELRPIFSGERRRGLALHSGAARTRPTPALENHLEAP